MIYRPTVEDIRFMKNMIAMLDMNGVWFYENAPIAFQKVADRTLALISAPRGVAAIDEQIERNKAVMAAAGVVFEDRRAPR